MRIAFTAGLPGRSRCEDLLAELLQRAKAALNADTATVVMLDRSSGYLIATAASGPEEEVLQPARVAVGRGLAGRIAAGNEPVVLEHVDETTVVNPVLLAKGIRSMAGVPLEGDRGVIGVLHVGSLTPRRFTIEDVEVLKLAASRAAAAVQVLAAQADRAALA